jgi:type IV pilus assembly protein PilA
MLTKVRAMQKRREDGESGFTLIELLVVMIIIGILAAIAIPIFQNQQKSARDSATTSDVRNVATNVQSALVKYPDAAYFEVRTGGTASSAATTSADFVTGTNGIVSIYVGDDATHTEKIDVSVSKGTMVSIGAGAGGAGSFEVDAYNTSGKSYTASGSALKYLSASGGLQN